MKIIIDQHELLTRVPSKYVDGLMPGNQNMALAKQAISYFVYDDEGQKIEQPAALDMLDEMPYQEIFDIIGSVNKAVGEALVPPVSARD